MVGHGIRISLLVSLQGKSVRGNCFNLDNEVFRELAGLDAGPCRLGVGEELAQSVSSEVGFKTNAPADLSIHLIHFTELVHVLEVHIDFHHLGKQIAFSPASGHYGEQMNDLLPR